MENSYQLVKSSAECALLHQQSLQWVRTQRQLVEIEYWAGNVTITRLRGAQNDLVDAECDLALALITLLKADAQLIAAISGRPEEEPLRSALPGWTERAVDSLEKYLKGAW